MRTRRRALLALLAVACAAPSGAQAATPSLDTAYPCYTAEESILLSGSGFTPNGRVALSSDGSRLATIATDPDGGFATRMSVPALGPMLRLRFAASDLADRTLVARTTVRVVSVGVDLVPGIGAPWRIFARGFIGSPSLYAHVRRKGGRSTRNIRIGRPRGACGTLGVDRRLFPRVLHPGSYSIQFDANRRYLRATTPSVRYSMTVSHARSNTVRP